MSNVALVSVMAVVAWAAAKDGPGAGNASRSDAKATRSSRLSTLRQTVARDRGGALVTREPTIHRNNRWRACRMFHGLERNDEEPIFPIEERRSWPIRSNRKRFFKRSTGYYRARRRDRQAETRHAPEHLQSGRRSRSHLRTQPRCRCCLPMSVPPWSGLLRKICSGFPQFFKRRFVLEQCPHIRADFSALPQFHFTVDQRHRGVRVFVRLSLVDQGQFRVDAGHIVEY